MTSSFLCLESEDVDHKAVVRQLLGIEHNAFAGKLGTHGGEHGCVGDGDSASGHDVLRDWAQIQSHL